MPPGKIAFCSEAGIKETDWSGKLRARWSDAVAEAGYTPQTSRAGSCLPPVALVEKYGLPGTILPDRQVQFYRTNPLSLRLSGGTGPTQRE